MPRLLIIVLGDLARSPRMLRHAEEALRHGAEVDLLGFVDHPLPGSVKAARIVRLPSLDALRTMGHASMPVAGLRVLLLTMALVARLTFRRRPQAILVQTPPLLPSLPVLLLFARIWRSPLLADWHNSTGAMVRQRFGEGFVSRAIARLERQIVRRTTHNLAVSDVMAGLVGSVAIVLRDGAPARFTKSDRRETFEAEGNGVQSSPLSPTLSPRRGRGRKASRVARSAPGLPLNALLIARPAESCALVVAPSSWSIDDDFALLVKALRLADDQLDEPISQSDPALIVALTGDGERRVAVEHEIDALQLRTITVTTGWLTEVDFIALLGSADAGISLHRSVSGADLPIKLAEMIACTLPVVALDYGSVLDEVLDPTVTRFRTAEELAAILVAIARRESRLPLAQPLPSWERSWEEKVWPLLDEAMR